MLLGNADDLKVNIFVPVVVTFHVKVKHRALIAKIRRCIAPENILHNKIAPQFLHFTIKYVKIESCYYVPPCMENNYVATKN